MNVAGVNRVSVVKSNQGYNNKNSCNPSFGRLVFTSEATRTDFINLLRNCRPISYVEEHVLPLIHAHAQVKEDVLVSGVNIVEVWDASTNLLSRNDRIQSLLQYVIRKLNPNVNKATPLAEMPTKTIEDVLKSSCHVLNHEEVEALAMPRAAYLKKIAEARKATEAEKAKPTEMAAM